MCMTSREKYNKTKTTEVAREHKDRQIAKPERLLGKKSINS